MTHTEIALELCAFLLSRLLPLAVIALVVFLVRRFVRHCRKLPRHRGVLLGGAVCACVLALCSALVWRGLYAIDLSRYPVVVEESEYPSPDGRYLLRVRVLGAREQDECVYILGTLQSVDSAEEPQVVYTSLPFKSRQDF